MKQEELIKIYKENIEKYPYEYTPYRYFISMIKRYKDIQDGIANKDNFFDETIGIFKETTKPKRKEDYLSSSGSRYWYYKDYLIRGSDHWGNGIVNCDWAIKLLNNKNVYGTSHKSPKSFKEEIFGYIKWKDFILKSKLININDIDVLTTFNNKISYDKYLINNKIYQEKIIILYEEIDKE